MRTASAKASLDEQRDALLGYDCDSIFKDTGHVDQRSYAPALRRCLGTCQPGDEVVVASLAALGMRMIALEAFLDHLERARIFLTILDEGVSTWEPRWVPMRQALGMMARAEGQMIRERTRSGLDAARAEGRTGGRPPALTPKQVEQVRVLVSEGVSLTKVAQRFKVSERTIRRTIADFDYEVPPRVPQPKAKPRPRAKKPRKPPKTSRTAEMFAVALEPYLGPHTPEFLVSCAWVPGHPETPAFFDALFVVDGTRVAFEYDGMWHVGHEERDARKTQAALRSENIDLVIRVRQRGLQHLQISDVSVLQVTHDPKDSRATDIQPLIDEITRWVNERRGASAAA